MESFEPDADRQIRDPLGPRPRETPEDMVAVTTRRAADAGKLLSAMTLQERAKILVEMADALDRHPASLIEMAVLETSLSETRLASELQRTTNQLRLFADVVLDGSFQEIVIDHADETQPDVRRVLHPIGPVAVFAAGNFPFAFSVAGGDTASALAAGAPAVVKAHPGHPRLSRMVAEVCQAAMAKAGAPEGALACVFGFDAGRVLVSDPYIRAVAFTGSLAGGRALFDVACSRPDPIPFYGELGSINPVIITQAAADRRGAEIAEGLVSSFTLGVGQFCTKPGLVLFPAESDIREAVAARVAGEREPMLNQDVAERFHTILRRFADIDGVEVIAGDVDQEGISASPVVFGTSASRLLTDPVGLLDECFGPSTLLVSYTDNDVLTRVVSDLPGSLAISIHGEPEEAEEVRQLADLLREKAGRLVWNGWPTGVAVVWSMHHGGPWPATTTPLHTSVGATAMRRFLRPVAYQNWPEPLLPPALRDGPSRGVRRVDGELVR